MRKKKSPTQVASETEGDSLGQNSQTERDLVVEVPRIIDTRAERNVQVAKSLGLQIWGGENLPERRFD
uniref:Uncharacterized protein n=1 Tax=Nelumbo nucifera TaxID=4432 RepID=A0A822YRU8_NELNU|nr:TPA_asm: hypothetical protein HUJ06_005880 [Nelumbo nucifera]